jgi:energy-coupling factor transporter ATP-binding protein EcfA2
MIERFIWGDSGSGLSEHAWRTAGETGAAWVGNDASAHLSLLRSTVREELAFGMEQQGVPAAEMARRIAAAERTWGLTELADRDPSRLSTGQTRRVAVAAALLRDPGALVLDCPLDGLDAPAVDTVRATLAGFEGEVTVYDRLRTPLAADAREELHLVDDRLVPAAAPEPELPAAAPGAASGKAVLDCDMAVTRGDFTVRAALTARAGEITHLAGPNGSGKTTVMLAVLGLLPHTGRLVAPVAGWAPTGMDAAFSRRTVRRELAVGTDRGHAEAALEWVGLQEWADVHPLDVPSSPRRMVAVAAALARGPELLMLDEPTVGLDAPGHAWLARVMRDYAAGEYHRRLGAPTARPAVLWTCHSASVARAVSSTSVVL